MPKAKPTIKCLVRPRHAAVDETIVEFSTRKGVGGLMSLRETDTGGLVLDLYRLDTGVTVRGPKPVIRFIVDTYTSEADRHGNCYHWARVTSTLTGRSIALSDVGGEQNAAYDVKRALEGSTDPWNAVWSTQHVVKRKYWGPPKEARFYGDVGPVDFLDLEKLE